MSEDSLKDKLRDMPLFPPRSESCEEYMPGQILGNFLVLSNKQKGVEPGSIVVLLEDLKEILNKINGTELNHENIIMQISENPELAKKIALDIFKKSNDIPIQKFLIKQDYPDGKKVSPPKINLKTTNSIKKTPTLLQPLASEIYKSIREKDPDDENINACLEVIGNNIAKSYGMPAQNQYMLIGHYNDGRPKIMTISKWEYGLIEIEGKISGSIKKSDYHNYLHNIFEDKNQKISELSSDYAIALLMGDRDYFGSIAQNKMVKEIDGKYFLFGIDFGHAFREENQYVSKINDNFIYKNKKIPHSMKNISIFYDSKLSEKMKGLLLIYQGLSTERKNYLFSADEIERIEQSINDYKTWHPDFQYRIESIQPGVIDRNFNDSISDLDLYSMKFEGQGSKFEKYKNKIELCKELALDSEEKMMLIFKSKMQLKEQDLDLLENIEKFTAFKLSFLSPDKSIKLDHVRIQEENRFEFNWHVFLEREPIIIQSNADGKIDVESIKRLQAMFKCLNLNNVDIQLDDNQVKIKMTKEEYDHFKQHFTEKKMLECRKIIDTKEKKFSISKLSKLSFFPSSSSSSSSSSSLSSSSLSSSEEDESSKKTFYDFHHKF